MYRKYFFKSKGVLSRKFVASGLSAVFSAGMFSSYAGAMEPKMDPNFILFNEKNQKDETQIEPVFPEKLNEDKMQEKDKELLQGITKENIKNIEAFSEEEEKVVDAVERCLSQIEKWIYYTSKPFWDKAVGRAVGRAVGSETALESGKYNLLRLYAYSFYLGFKNGSSFSEGYKDFYSFLLCSFGYQHTCAYEPFIKLNSDTKNKLLSEVEDKKNVKEENEKEENEKNNSKNDDKESNLSMGSEKEEREEFEGSSYIAKSSNNLIKNIGNRISLNNSYFAQSNMSYEKDFKRRKKDEKKEEKEINMSEKSGKEIKEFLEKNESIDEDVKKENLSMKIGGRFSYGEQSNSENIISLNNSYFSQPKGKKEEKKVIKPGKLDEKKINQQDKNLLKSITKENIKNTEAFSEKEKEVVSAVARCLSQRKEWVCNIIKSKLCWNKAVGSETLKSGKYDLLRLYAYSFYLGFKNGGSFSEGYKDFYSYLLCSFGYQHTCAYEPFIKLNSDTKNKLLSEVEDKKNVKEENEKEENEKNDLKENNKKISLLEKSGEEIEELLEENKSTVKQKLGENIKNKTKNKLKKMIVVVPVIILLALIIKTLAVKGKSNTDNNNKDDEKVNPPINPETPLTDPESDEQNPEQKKQEQGSQEQKPSVVPNNILKVTGATVAAGGLAGGGSYLVNEVVLKRGKSSNVSPKNGDDEEV